MTDNLDRLREHAHILGMMLSLSWNNETMPGTGGDGRVRILRGLGWAIDEPVVYSLIQTKTGELFAQVQRSFWNDVHQVKLTGSALTWLEIAVFFSLDSQQPGAIQWHWQMFQTDQSQNLATETGYDSSNEPGYKGNT